MATNTSPTKTAEPYFIVPPGFRANAICVGRDKELEELGRRLFDVKRRRDGTACVLLHGQPGGGKTHLARQYVNKNRKKFTGGVFWITAKSKEERYHAFWNIKQKVVCRDKPHLCDGVNGDDFVPTVKSWFEARQEWLLIFDGITVEREDDATELAKFIPDSQNSSIIYISWAKNLEFNQRLFRPHPIKVGPLNEADAKRLLFKELHMKKPTEGEKRKATDLVRKIGGLPLAINAISRRLADTHEPLTKYKLSCSADPTIEGTYNKILDDLQRLGHMEAWNLVHILCWFAQEIPVEMVHLGLRILRTEDVEVRATQAGGRPDINTTFGQLMRYALIERNEPDDRESMSSSRDSLVDPEPIDMLKIHTVVQNYCCDSLSSRNMLPQWLGYAVKLFSFSYYQADMKIKQKPDTGRVSDYRYYKVHGQRLFDHALHYEARMQSLERIRVTLQPTLNMIDDEILLREPSASQESLQEGNGIFQVSIFDRTSSSSDSGPGPITPDHRPTPPPLGNETLFGFPLGKPMDSPASFGTASPGIRPKIVDLSPGRRLPADADYGYEGDREGQRTSHPMEPKLSDTTARHSSRSPTSSIGSPSDSWQVVPPSWKTRKSRGRRDLGSFRPTAARAKVDTRSATGSVTPSNRDVKSPRETSPAFKSLKRVQSRRPPSSQSGVSSFWQRGPLTCPPTVANQPTWAAVAAKDPSQQQHQEPQSAPARPVPSPMITERGRSRESLNARPSPAPLASKFVPYQRTAGTYETKNFLISPASPGHTHEYPPAGLTYLTPYPGSNSGLAQTIQGPPTDIYLNPYSAPPARLGPNPASLAIEEGITTSKRPLPSEFSEQQLTQYFPTLPSGHLSQSPPSRTSPHQPYQQTYDASYPVPTMPSGYTSQPMSQQGSHQSYNSVAETDPIQYPSSFSPQIAPIHSSRDRHSDGSPYRKSPKTDFALPVSAAFASPQTSPYDLSHAGGWAYPPSPSHSAPGLHDTSMSRSSSGPGLAIEGTPGGIVRFEDAGSVQFGEHQPISMEEARRRMGEHEVHLQERQRKGDAWERREEADSRRGSSAPYPEHSLIPTGSDGVALEDMVGGRRVSGNSQNGAVGLGMDMG